MLGSQESAIRLRPYLAEDPYSAEETQLDWSAAYALNIQGVLFNPGSTNEPSEVGRNAVSTQPEAYVPAGSDVLPGDRLRIRGRDYDVDGDAADWRLGGWRPGLVIKLRIVEG